MRTRILNVPFDVITRKEALNKLLTYLEEERNHVLYTPNPEMVLKANRDREFMDILKKADLVIPDGIGIVMASQLNKEKIKERVAGCDLIFALFEKLAEKNTVYLLGGKPGVCELAKKNMEEKYKNLRIIGFHNGYFNSREEEVIIKEIQRLKPDILLVGLGFPRQEKWIYAHRKRLTVKLSAGVGGSLDVMAGTVKRAPKLFQKLGLEWFYRLMRQPSRIGRILQLPLFLVKVICSRRRNDLDNE